MKTLCIFIASSICEEELKDDRDWLVTYSAISPKEQGKYVKLILCERENRALWKQASRMHSPHGRNLRETEHRKNREEEISHVSRSIAQNMHGVVDMCNKKQRYVASR